MPVRLLQHKFTGSVMNRAVHEIMAVVLHQISGLLHSRLVWLVPDPFS